MAVIDDDEIVLDGVRRWLADDTAGIAVTATVRTVWEMLTLPPGTASIVLLDLRLRDRRSIGDNVHDLVAAGLIVIACSARDDRADILEAINSGAHSYVRKAKDASAVLRAVQDAAHGRPHISPAHAAAMDSPAEASRAGLSAQERETLRLYASGLTLKQVAEMLRVTPHTAKGYLERVRSKYRNLDRPASSKLELRDRAIEDQVLPRPRPGPIGRPGA
ncbi:response regulator [Streptomyces sp. NBC_00285]|uniref:response regulator transcription factor n=1 Tax=Streptomyces sp. NBC_00285 TaxID=2975700 RepID=UPI002E284E5A|nr:response regulator [Streptomyces sp. NBC_00285]